MHGGESLVTHFSRRGESSCEQKPQFSLILIMDSFVLWNVDAGKICEPRINVQKLLGICRHRLTNRWIVHG